MSLKQGFQIVVMGDQSSEIEVKKEHMFDDFSDAAEAFVQVIEEQTGETVNTPRRVSEATETINDVLFQIWRVDFPSTSIL